MAVSLTDARSAELYRRALEYLPGGVNSPVRAMRAAELAFRRCTRLGAWTWDTARRIRARSAGRSVSSRW